jgi:hypothetical protein
MNKYVVMVTEVYYKAIAIEACDAETAEALVQGQWDQGAHDLANEKDCFDHVEVAAEEAHALEEAREGAADGAGFDV